MRGRSITLMCGATVVLTLAVAAAAHGQIRIVNYNVAQLQGDETALQAVFTWAMGDDRPGFAVAPHAFALQEVRSADAPVLLEMINGAAPPGVARARRS